jgi:hypothetical protein
MILADLRMHRTGVLTGGAGHRRLWLVVMCVAAVPVVVVVIHEKRIGQERRSVACDGVVNLSALLPILSAPSAIRFWSYLQTTLPSIGAGTSGPAESVVPT